MATKRDYYEVLGVSKNATDDELKKALNLRAENFSVDENMLYSIKRKIKNQRLTKRKQNYIIIIVLNRTLIRRYNKEEKYVFLGSA